MVNDDQLRKVMRQHGWRDSDISDTAGFHSNDNNIYLLRGNEWSQLHEMAHAAGIVDKDLAPWITEGITECVAADIAKKKKWKHRGTYPEFVRIVRKDLAPTLGLTTMQIGQVVAAAPAHAGRDLSKRLSLRTNIPARTWYKAIGPGAATPGQFNRLLEKAT
tara:strand:- start:277 stop:762 length:486 start_codon:yes stop_codon:yes gene_type:complete